MSEQNPNPYAFAPNENTQVGSTHAPGTFTNQTPDPYSMLPATPKTNTLSIVSVVLSLMGIITFITAPIGAILGHVALSQIKKTGEEGKGLALTGIIAGWIITGLGVIGVALVITLLAGMLSYGIGVGVNTDVQEFSESMAMNFSAWGILPSNALLI